MFKRILDMYKRKDAEKNKPVLKSEKFTVKAPEPKAKQKEKQFTSRAYGRLRQSAIGKKWQSMINEGGHEAAIKHIMKPMKPFPVRTDFSKSAAVHIERQGRRK